MILKDDEEWIKLPPTNTGMWQLTIRNKKGEYRTPTHAEISALINASKRKP